MSEPTQQHAQTVASAETSLGRGKKKLIRRKPPLPPGSITCVVASGAKPGSLGQPTDITGGTRAVQPDLMEKEGCASNCGRKTPLCKVISPQTGSQRPQ